MLCFANWKSALALRRYLINPYTRASLRLGPKVFPSSSTWRGRGGIQCQKEKDAESEKWKSYYSKRTFGYVNVLLPVCPEMLSDSLNVLAVSVRTLLERERGRVANWLEFAEDQKRVTWVSSEFGISVALLTIPNDWITSREAGAGKIGTGMAISIPFHSFLFTIPGIKSAPNVASSCISLLRKVPRMYM